ncbi:MAG: PUR family DNA/RNA-binding protein [Prevotellaceae bacterium]|nr:PUR family DNA/RNA-binding protein [Prevotellaceae bacterium]
MDDFEKYDDRPEELFSKPVKAGKRTYFFDVKATRDGEQYLTITESKRKIDRDGSFSYEKHKIFLYREDFDKFLAGMHEALDYIAENAPAEAAKPARSDKEEASSSYSDVNFDDLGEK